VCFDEVRKTKAWNYNPLVSSVLHFAFTQGNMHPMIRDVVLGEKFPLLMLFYFSLLIAWQRAECGFVFAARNTSYPAKCSFQIGNWMKHERNVISVEP
jgi:hypothetical protein